MFVLLFLCCFVLNFVIYGVHGMLITSSCSGSPERKLRTEKEGASSSKNGIEDLKTRASKADEKLSIG